MGRISSNIQERVIRSEHFKYKFCSLRQRQQKIGREIGLLLNRRNSVRNIIVLQTIHSN